MVKFLLCSCSNGRVGFSEITLKNCCPSLFMGVEDSVCVGGGGGGAFRGAIAASTDRGE